MKEPEKLLRIGDQLSPVVQVAGAAVLAAAPVSCQRRTLEAEDSAEILASGFQAMEACLARPGRVRATAPFHGMLHPVVRIEAALSWQQPGFPSAEQGTQRFLVVEAHQPQG